jgi:hypothetical protein
LTDRKKKKKPTTHIVEDGKQNVEQVRHAVGLGRALQVKYARVGERRVGRERRLDPVVLVQDLAVEPRVPAHT